MRVITGVARGVRLGALEGIDTRPTIERVKEAMFSAIQFEVPGRRVLDLFAGSGQLGIEALSRGAVHADFADSSKDSCAVIADNLKRCNFEDTASVFCRDWRSFLESATSPYHLVLLDPPYGKGLCAAAMEKLVEKNLITEQTIVICETADKESLPDEIGPLSKTRTARYGAVRLTTYRGEQK